MRPAKAQSIYKKFHTNIKTFKTQQTWLLSIILLFTLLSFEELVPILHICENWVPILHIWENRTSPSQMTRIRTNYSQLIMRKMWNLSKDVRPPKLSKLTIRNFHIFQKWRFGTNSSHGVKFAKCKICSLTWLYNAAYVILKSWLKY